MHRHHTHYNKNSSTYQHVTCTSLVLKFVIVTAEFHPRHLQQSSFPRCIKNSPLSDFRNLVLYTQVSSNISVSYHGLCLDQITIHSVPWCVCFRETEFQDASNWGLINNCAPHISPLKDVVIMTQQLVAKKSACRSRILIALLSAWQMFYCLRNAQRFIFLY